MASAPEAWRPLGRPVSRARLFAALLIAATLGACVVLELGSTCFADWTVGHPLTVTVAVGILLIGLTVLGLDRLIAAREGRRWRLPTLLAIDTYLYSADRAGRRIYGRIIKLAEPLAPKPRAAGPINLGWALELILNHERDRLVELSDLVREEADMLAATAMQTSSVAARSDRFAADVERIFEEQDRLGRLAGVLNGVHILSGGLGGPGDDAYRVRVTASLEEARDLLEGFLSELGNLRIAVAEAMGN